MVTSPDPNTLLVKWDEPTLPNGNIRTLSIKRDHSNEECIFRSIVLILFRRNHSSIQIVPQWINCV